MAGFAKEGFNMYYPPEWRPECGDLDKFHGGHKLRDQVFSIISVEKLKISSRRKKSIREFWTFESSCPFRSGV